MIRVWKQWFFESKIDYGLGRLCFIIIVYNTALLLTSYYFKGELFLVSLPIILCFTYLLFYPKICKSGFKTKFFLSIFPPAISSTINYYMVGQLDIAMGGSTRMDLYLIQFDFLLEKIPLALWFEDLFNSMAPFTSIIYDILIFAYILYFLLPYYAAIQYYRFLPPQKKYRIGWFSLNLTLYYMMNFTLYLIIPVTGPQYFLESFFQNPFPFSPFGHFLYKLVQEGQLTFIDCFPSGHFGVCFLLTIFLYREKNKHYKECFVITGLVAISTLALRYHYSLDLFAAMILAFVSLKMSRKIFFAKLGQMK